jgi:hypothetical protein
VTDQERADELIATWLMDSGQFARVKIGDLNDRIAAAFEAVRAEAMTEAARIVSEVDAGDEFNSYSAHHQQGASRMRPTRPEGD